MGQTPEQIEGHIERKRRDLRSNLAELEDKVKAVTDWRQVVRNNPAATLAAAFGGGLLLSMRGRRRPRSALAAPTPLSRTPRLSGAPRGEGYRSWQSVKDTLVGVAAGKLQQVLTDLVPGFREHLADDGARQPRRQRRTQAESVQGEGDYESARRYRRGVEEFVRHADIETSARSAAPRDEQEAAELAAAERAGRNRGQRPG